MLKLFKKFSCIFLIIMLIMNFFIPKDTEVVKAKTLADLKAELKKAEDNYSNNQNEKAKTEEEIKTAKNKIVALNREKEKIQGEVVTLEEELKILSEEIDRMQDEIKSIMNYYQLSSGESAYLEYIFNAADYTDFIYRLAITEQLSNYNDKLIDEYNGKIEENNKKIKELEEKQVSLNNVQQEVSKELTNLGNDLSSIAEEAIEIKEEINDLKKQVNTYQNTYKCSLNEELSTCITRYNNSLGNGYLPSAAGFYRPILTGALNYEYGYTAKYGAFHDGIDFSIPHGTPVYAVADGKVVSVKSHQGCGGNMVYIAHKVNGKSYTSAYFHLADPILVKQGQVVTYNTKIGTSGGVPGIEWWDRCTTGAHLHFQIATGLYTTDYFWYSNFQSRSFNPRLVINFPGTDVRFHGR